MGTERKNDGDEECQTVQDTHSQHALKHSGSRDSMNDLLKDVAHLGVTIPSERGFGWKLLAYLGPGFLVCIAYLDPANFQSDLAAGGKFGFELIWVLLMATCFGLLIQTLSAKLGVVTGRHLAEHCREEYPRFVYLSLWLVAEISVIAADIPEVIGTATALKLLFHIDLWIGVLITGFSTFVFLFLQQFGIRKLEIFISLLVMVMAVCFLIELHKAEPDVGELMTGMFKPSLSGSGATGIAISLIGANIMPHNLFLHSGLVLTRNTPRSHRAVRDGIVFNRIEVTFAMIIAYVINVSVIGTSASLCKSEGLSQHQKDVCGDMAISDIPDLLRDTLGKSAPTIFAISLLASGQSSTITATYAGEYIMQGFLQLRYPRWVRNLITRLVALVPSLLVALIGGQRASANLIITCSMILSFCLPFDLMPLLKFTSSRIKMGPYTNRLWFTVIMWCLGVLTMGLNIYFLTRTYIEWMISPGGVGNTAVVFISILVFILIIFYFFSLLYLAFRNDREKTYIELADDDYVEEKIPRDASIPIVAK